MLDITVRDSKIQTQALLCHLFSQLTSCMAGKQIKLLMNSCHLYHTEISHRLPVYCECPVYFSSVLTTCQCTLLNVYLFKHCLLHVFMLKFSYFPYHLFSSHFTYHSFLVLGCLSNTDLSMPVWFMSRPMDFLTMGSEQVHGKCLNKQTWEMKSH